MARRHEMNAQDFLSEAMMMTWIKFRRKILSDAEPHMRNFTFRCITNNSRKWYRKTKREEQIEANAGALPNMSAMLDEAKIAQMLDDILAKLPPSEEAAIRLCYLTNPQPKPQDAAHALGCSVATLYRRIEHARVRLGSAFADLGLEYSF